MRPGYRLLSGLLCLTLLISGLGCVTAGSRRSRTADTSIPGVDGGSSGPARDPVQVIRGEPGSETVWIYRYEGGPTAAVTILLVIFFVAIIAVALMGRAGVR